MNETEVKNYWRSFSDHNRPVMDPNAILEDELWSLGWE